MAVAIACLTALALTGCRDPGPAEETGREIDEAVEDARDALDQMGDDTQEVLEEVEDRRD